MDKEPLVLLTGASGYVGGRLLKALESAGQSVRCLARRPEFLLPKAGPKTEVIAGDVLDRAGLAPALSGVDTAYYLVHSMATEDFEQADRLAAQNFAAAARDAGVRKIIYLGGLGDSSGGRLSPHLHSRQEVGKILCSSGVCVIEFRASVIIGSGSLSFEMVRALVERLPVMITPKWVGVPAQPLAIEDLLQYLVRARELPGLESRIFEIGGPDRVSYAGLMREYARQRGLRRLMIRVPVLTPRLSSLWLGLVTPVYARIGRKLIDSIRHPTVVNDDIATKVFSLRPMGVREAIANALRDEDRELAATWWSDAQSSGAEPQKWGGVRFGSRLIDSRTVQVNVPPAVAFEPIRRIGGTAGWYYANWLWRLRGWLDLLVGGVGLRRGRRDPRQLRVGDVVDCWRVEAFEPDACLRLAAEMKLPGRAWLEFKVEITDDGSMIRQTAIFDPVGLWGLAYWYGVYPLHGLIFGGMLREIARIAVADKKIPIVPP
ncbi:MAG: SDR family oxidoreductase [Methylacidiphilales bacterium]|nr:SDR family oxidoreductase [Candidatus Methylacidiphilales bacterium]